MLASNEIVPRFFSANKQLKTVVNKAYADREHGEPLALPKEVTTTFSWHLHKLKKSGQITAEQCETTTL